MGTDNDWVCTDPSTDQWGRHITGLHYQFKEGGSDPVNIVLSSYTNGQIEHFINAYGYTLYSYKNNCVNICIAYPEDYNWIIAECVFELEAAPLLQIQQP